MNSLDRSSLRKILAALSPVLLLGIFLGIRIASRARIADGSPLPIGRAVVPAPAPIRLETLTFPCWGCPDADSWPIQFRTNLDLLAPLGTGTENAARWFGDFAKPNGSRSAEAEAAMNRRVEGRDGLGKILPPDDPLLREAEPWCDQATMRFYPDVFPLRGADTQIPNMLLALSFARSWVARGEASSDPERAMEDFRRAIRLGRLLRQDDVVLIDDLVGLAAIRLGTEGIYDLARRQGNMKLALAASLVLGEHAAQRLRTAEQVTKFDVMRYVSGPDAAHVTLEVPDRKVDEIIGVATKGSDRRFRFEAMLSLNIVRFLGSHVQQAKAAETLTALATSLDPLNASVAEWARDTPPSPDRFENLFSDKTHPMGSFPVAR